MREGGHLNCLIGGLRLPPLQSSPAEYHYHRILATVVEDVLRRRSGRVKVSELASAAGFSRFHLTRLFRFASDETLETFLRRIRLERAAYSLLYTDQRVYQVARTTGYRSPEAFSRAFRRAFGCLPTEAKQRLDTWQIEATSDLHWNADWALDECSVHLEERVLTMPPRHAWVWRTVGDYSTLAESWERLAAQFDSDLPSAGTFITIYRDNLWTHPVCRTMQADLGWLCDQDAPAPNGMRKVVIPGGCYATTRFVDRDERTDAWSKMWGRYPRPRSDQSTSISYDEYSCWPLPFANVKTRLLVSV